MEWAENSDTWLYPKALFRDPFRGQNNRLAFCEAQRYDGLETPGNNRKSLREKLTTDSREFIAIQDYLVRDLNHDPSKLVFTQFCGIGTGNVQNRDVSECQLRALTHAGVPVHAMYPSKETCVWTLEIGPASSLAICDYVWMTRFILQRVAESFTKVATFFDTNRLTIHRLEDKSEGLFDRKRGPPSKSPTQDPYLIIRDIL
jgi:glutamine synthetase